ncbi:MAG: GerW family sporulation protein [Clostridia bacterium]|nr:GerW family sporulation protein [Clostridia bacterium]
MKDTSAAAMLAATIENVKSMVDVSTVIGEPVHTADGITLLPVSKVTYGFASGGSDFPSKSNKELFGGGGGAGVTVIPIAFLIIKDGEVSLKQITAFDDATERLVSLVPEMFDKIKAAKNKKA